MIEIRRGLEVFWMYYVKWVYRRGKGRRLFLFFLYIVFCLEGLVKLGSFEMLWKLVKGGVFFFGGGFRVLLRIVIVSGREE